MEQDLLKIGLTQYEAKTYLSLLKSGSVKGSTLSKKSGVPHSKIYEVMYKLADKKFVSVLEVRPRLFKAISPEIAIPHFLRSKKEELERLEKEIPLKLKLEAVKVEPKSEELITVYRGEKNTHPLVLNKFITAQKYLKEMFTFEYVPAAVEREIKKSMERGVHIKMIATLKNKESVKMIRRIKKMGAEVRYYPLNEIRFAIKDGVESYQMIVNQKNLLDRISIVIESIELTKALEHYFDYLWKKAKPIT